MQAMLFYATDLTGFPPDYDQPFNTQYHDLTMSNPAHQGFNGKVLLPYIPVYPLTVVCMYTAGMHTSGPEPQPYLWTGPDPPPNLSGSHLPKARLFSSSRRGPVADLLVQYLSMHEVLGMLRYWAVCIKIHS